MSRIRSIAAAVAVLACAQGAVDLQANPYGVTGGDWRPGGLMESLGMPKDCYGIHWGVLQETNVPQMPRPCKPSARSCRFSAYHAETDTIEDKEKLAAWVREHPGKVWVLGNEPDNPGQDGDGLTTEQYAAFYHRYHELISGIDPTARFAVGALAGDAAPGQVENDMRWWEEVLKIYRERYGEPMPVDIWNYHCYAPPYLRDADRYMELYVDPFCEWVKTVDGGRYRDCEIWTTEFGIGFWMGALNARWVEPWMDRVCLRLERSDVDRWFWFLGSWDRWTPGGDWQQTALVGADGTPTILGRRYADLARGYPNGDRTPLRDPAPREPPARFTDDFDDGDVSDWIDKSGPWIADAGTYRCKWGYEIPGFWGDKIPRWWGHHTLKPFVYGDFTAEVDVKIFPGGDDEKHWAGFYLRAPEMFGGPAQGGYLVYLRRNGELGVYLQSEGSVVKQPNVVEDTSTWHRLKVTCRGTPTRIEVEVDGEPRASWTDPKARFSKGFTALASGKADCAFDNLSITVLPATGEEDVAADSGE